MPREGAFDVMRTYGFARRMQFSWERPGKVCAKVPFDLDGTGRGYFRRSAGPPKSPWVARLVFVGGEMQLAANMQTSLSGPGSLDIS